MRVIDYIKDSELKITLFDWNDKYIVQCEDGDIIVSYKYKKENYSINDIKSGFTSDKLSWINSQIKRMRIEKPHANNEQSEDEFDVII